MKKLTAGKIFCYLIVYIAAIVVLLPVFHMILSCFKTTEEINRVVFLPSSLNFQNFISVFKTVNVGRSFLNSIVITASTIFCSIIICSLAAYPLGRYNKGIFQFIYYLFMSAMMIPTATTLLPVYKLIYNLGLKDTRSGLVLLYTAGGITMGILLYTGFVKTIPKQFEEAATIDGYGYIGRYIHIILPLLMPVTVTYAVLSTISVWNDFFYPMLFITSASKKPVTLMVYSFKTMREADLGSIYALLITAATPPVLFFIITQKYFIRGMTIGAIKG